MLKAILPETARNDPSVGDFNIIVFGFITAITILRSMAHIFLPDGGANSIATIIQFSGTPDPNNVVYFVFALWGLSQLLMGFVYLIVLLKYRNLIPLMWILVLFEYSMRIIIGRFLKPLTEVYFVGTAPGEIGNYILVPMAAIMIVMSIWEIKNKSKTK